MNALQTGPVLSSDKPRGAFMSEPRVIKKYPNRRLYDTVESRYITLADIRRLVTDGVEFVVIDKKSQDDITRSILLQVISEQEHAGEPLMSQDFLSQIIRSYGSAMQSFVGTYLEQSLKMLAGQQQQMREQMRGLMGSEAYDNLATLTQKNIERWRAMQEDVLKAMTGTATPRSNPPTNTSGEDSENQPS
jgi:polyhydroxyalkanoate synthesis repressor PhaR